MLDNAKAHLKQFVSNPSTWVVVVAVVLLAFIAVPYGNLIWLFLASILLLICALILAHHEGRQIEREYVKTHVLHSDQK